MSQKTVTEDDSDYDEIREEMMTTKGVERSTLDIAEDDHVLSGMDSERQAPVEAVAKNVVDRYDRIKAFYREYMANAHTACIQRAKWELKQAGIDDVDYTDVREVLERAREEVGYEPVIVVKRNENPEDYSLRIEDNGIGISRETAYAIRDIGLSGWHDDESTNGTFGQGTMSGFLPVDTYGEFDMHTWSVVTDENYRARWKLTDLDKLPGKRDSYGTTFEFPYFIDEAQEIDDYEAVREYAEPMIVPVIYEHYDENGRQDGTLSDDWGASYIEDRYADDSPVVSYEDPYGKIVWSPDDPDSWDTNLKTYCGYQPIDRNDSGIGTQTYSMPSGFDIRVKVENGCIVVCDEDPSLVGKVPVSKNKYEHLSDDQLDDHVVRSNVPDDAVVAPEPTDDRDRFESKNVSDFMRYYAGQLESVFKGRVADVIEQIDGLEDIPDLDGDERSLLLEGIDEYVDVYSQNDVERLQDDIEEEFGVRPGEVLASNIGVVKNEFGSDVSDKFAIAVGRMKQARLGSIDTEEEFGETVSEMTDQVSLAPRSSRASSVSRSTYRDDTYVWELVDMVGDDGDVFMAKTLSCARKVALAWELHEDNQVVQVDRYDKWAEMFGWQKLKDLPSRNFEERLDFDVDLDDDFIDEWDPASGDSSSGSGSSDDSNDLSMLSYNDKRAMKRSVKVRHGSGHGKFDSIRGETLFEKLDSGESYKIGYSKFDICVLYKETEHNTSVGSRLANSSRGIGYAVVPNYVYEYLIDAQNAMTENEYIEYEKRKWFEFDWSDSDYRTGAEVSDLDERDVIVYGDSLKEAFESWGLMDRFVDEIESLLDDVDAVRSITFREHLDEYRPVLNIYGAIGGDCHDDDMPTLVKSDDTYSAFGSGYHVTETFGVESTFFDCVLPELDRDAFEWDHFDPDMNDSELIEALQELEDAGGFVSTDDDSELPEWVNTDLGVGPVGFWQMKTMERFAEETSYFSDDVSKIADELSGDGQ